MKKRFISIFMAAVLAMMPVAAFAEENDGMIAADGAAIVDEDYELAPEEREMEAYDAKLTEHAKMAFSDQAHQAAVDQILAAYQNGGNLSSETAALAAEVLSVKADADAKQAYADEVWAEMEDIQFIAENKEYIDAEGAYAFYILIGAEEAAYYLENAYYSYLTRIGDPTDAIAWDNMTATVQWLRKCNYLRSINGLAPLKVNLALMAMAQSDANFSDTQIAHAQQFNVGENVAWNYGSDPYTQWYDQELYNLQTGNGGQTGHYFNIVTGAYKSTGFGICTRGTMNGWNTYAQVFSYSENPDDMTVDEFEELLYWYRDTVLSVNANTLYQAQLEAEAAVAAANAAKEKLAKAEGELLLERVTGSRKNATCTADGKKLDYACVVCDYVKAGAVIPATGHTIVTQPGKAATCTTDGITEGSYCETCKTVLKAQTTVKAYGHNVVIDKGVPATCGKAGYTDGKHCSRCNVILVDQIALPALGHTFVNDEVHCDNCGTAKPTTPVMTKCYNTSSGVKIMWEPVSGVKGYLIQRRIGDGSYENYQWIKDTSVTSFVDTEATVPGEKYTYKIMSYIKVDGKNLYSKSSYKTSYYLKKTTISSATAGTKGVTLKWSAVEKATFYKVWAKYPGKSDFEEVARVYDALTYTDSNKSAKAGTIYKVTAMYTAPKKDGGTKDYKALDSKEVTAK